MSHFLDSIRQSIARHHLLSDDSVVIVALSGGADSVALLSALTSLGYRCIAAHCNFHLRGEESDRDERHAADIAKQLGADFVVTHFQTEHYAYAHNMSIEMAARELRYQWFESIRLQYNAEAIAVAHHRDDNIETFFLNLLRGTGIAGLTGMSPKRDNIVRPMLELSRDDIVAYLNENNLPYVTDSTNADCEFKRNRLRNVVLPMLRRQFPGADDAITHTIACLRGNEKIYRDAIEVARAKYFNGNTLRLSALLAEHPEPYTLLFELLRTYGFNSYQVADIFISADNSGRQFRSYTHTALINRGELLITPISELTDPDSYFVSLNTDILEPINIKIFKFRSSHGFVPVSDPSTIYLDASVLNGNPEFTIRRWKKGDRIAPFGMRGTKKLSDIFSDAHLSIIDKQSKWILTRNDEILWIIGMRASRHFPVTESSSMIIRLSID